MKQSSPHESSIVDRILKILLVFLIIFLLFQYINQSEDDLQSEQNPAQRKYSLERVNEHILMTQDAIEIDRIKTRDELSRSAPELRVTKPQRNYHQNNTLSLDYDQSSYEVSSDLGRSTESSEHFAESPAELIQNDIYQQQKKYETELEFIERKKQQIITNARTKGYEIELDDRGERIIKWKKIKPDSNKYRSPSGSSAR